MLHNLRICELHFKDWCFMNVTSKHYLVKNAVPVIDKPAACYSELSASVKNAETCSHLKDSSAKKLHSCSCISELHFEDLCDKYNLLDYAVPIADKTSVLNHSTASIGNTAVVSQPTEYTLKPDIPKLSEVQKNARCLPLQVYLQKGSVSKSDQSASVHNGAVVKRQTGKTMQPKTSRLLKAQKSRSFAQLKTPSASICNILVPKSQAESTVQSKAPHLPEVQKRGFTQTETSLNVSETSAPKETVKILLPVNRTYLKVNTSSKQAKDTLTSCKDAVASLQEVSIPEHEAQKSFTQIEIPAATIHNLAVINSQTESMVQPKIPHLYVSESCTPWGAVKRHLSESSIHSKENSSFKQTKENTSTSCKDDVVTFNTAIIKEDFPCELLTDVDVGKIQTLILERIDCISSEGPKPCLKNFNLDDGILVYTCSDETSCLWLKETLEGKIIGGGTPLMVMDPKKVPHPVKVVFNTKDAITTDSSKLLRRLQFFNSRLQVRYWRVLDRKQKKCGQQLILQVDPSSFTAIKEANFKAFTGVDEGTFTVVSIPKPVKLVNNDLLKGLLFSGTHAEKQSDEPHPATIKPRLA